MLRFNQLLILFADQLLSTIIPRSSPQNIEISAPVSSVLQPLPAEQIPVYEPPTIPTVYENTQQNNLQTSSYTPRQSSNLSSVFSSFSSILSLGSQNTSSATQEEVVLPPAGIESFINQDNPNVEPVPLFPAISTIPLSKSTPDQSELSETNFLKFRILFFLVKTRKMNLI